MLERTFDPAYHWYQIMVPDAVTVMVLFSGGRTAPFFTRAISSPLEILVKSDTREESRAEPANPPSCTNPIVPRITKMVMTTMSSTRVKPLYFFVFMW